MKKIDLGNHSEVATPDCIKALIVEFITTFLFVFAGVGSAMATGKFSFFYLYQLLLFLSKKKRFMLFVSNFGFHLSRPS